MKPTVDCKNCSHECSYHCAQLLYTTRHRTVLTIFPLNLPTIITYFTVHDPDAWHSLWPMTEQMKWDKFIKCWVKSVGWTQLNSSSHNWPGRQVETAARCWKIFRSEQLFQRTGAARRCDHIDSLGSSPSKTTTTTTTTTILRPHFQDNLGKPAPQR